VNVTLDIADQLIADANALAAREGVTLAHVIEEGLRLRLAVEVQPVRKPCALPVFKGRGGLCRGVDSLSNRSMREAADDA